MLSNVGIVFTAFVVAGVVVVSVDSQMTTDKSGNIYFILTRFIKFIQYICISFSSMTGLADERCAVEYD